MGLLVNIRSQVAAQRNAIEKLRKMASGEVSVLRPGESVDCPTGICVTVKLRPVHPEWARVIASAIGIHLEVVESVMWNGEEIRDDLLSVLCEFHHLESLSLTGTGIDPNGLAELRRDQDFTRLSRLAETTLDDSQLKRIARLTNLKTLYLKGIDAEQGGLIHLAALSRVEQIELDGVKFNAAELRRLRSELPRCQIALK